ncbi:MAG TPA: VOC family protein, partial [Sphingomicrobium sp.]|nr:VOC family protein [Sphingomicrobium sp.]
DAKPQGEMDYRMIGRSDGGNAGGVMRLTDEMKGHGAKPIWLGYVAVDDVDASVSSIEQGGGKALMPAFDIPDVGRIAMVADPQGVAFYVMKPIPPAGNEDKVSDVFSPDQPQRVSWNELATRDQVAALEFYTSRFGWTKGDVMPMGDMGDYQFITHHGVPLGAMMTASPENSARWRFYFRVPNTDAAAEAVRANGGTINHGPAEVPGGDRILIGTDPQGAEFALVGK